MNSEITFWTAIGPVRHRILNWAIYLILVFTVLPVFVDEEVLMGVYASVFALYALAEFVIAVQQLVVGTINGVTFIYRLWWCFLVMLLLLAAFLLAGLVSVLYR